MMSRPCMECDYPDAQHIDGPSADAIVDYFRCPDCWCVFCVPKDQPSAPPKCISPGYVRTPARD